MERKIVFFDIDGTIYDWQNGILESTNQAIRRLRDNGHLAFICSGRPRPIITEELLSPGFDGIVCGCGTYIECEGRKLYECQADQETAVRTTNWLRKEKLHAIYEGHQQLYYDDEADFEALDTQYVRIRELFSQWMTTIRDRELHYSKISVILNGRNPAEIPFWELEDLYEIICFESGISAELVLKGNSKATGIERVIRHYGIARENTYAFGDSANDLEMIRYVAHGIAMGNASSDIREAAEFQTKMVSEDGIWYGLEKMGLI